jgi:hypothetical protein
VYVSKVQAVVLVVFMKYCVVRLEKYMLRMYSFFKKYESEDGQSRLNLSKCQDLAAEACGVHKSNVSLICRDTKKSGAQGESVSVSPRKKINMAKK